MAYRFVYNGLWDWRRFNREWREMHHISRPFLLLDRQARQTGDTTLVAIMADCCEECGYGLLANMFRKGGIKLQPSRKRRRARR